MIRQRRDCRDPQQRRELSKRIYKLARKHAREYCTLQIRHILESFKKLHKFERTHKPLINPLSNIQCQSDDFANLLAEIYNSSDVDEQYCKDSLRALPRFTLKELQNALKHMSLNKCGDQDGIYFEMIKYGSERLHTIYLTLINTLISSGSTDDSWRHTLFTMIPKAGDLTQASNYRPIAILSTFYKIFARMVYSRLLPLLDSHQSNDQCGFRPGMRLDDALVVAETVISKCNEFNLPLWIASLDIKKAFDRVSRACIFEALRAQGISEPMIALLIELYSCQTGATSGSKTFSILRGVRQGDVISSPVQCCSRTCFSKMESEASRPWVATRQ